ncbi:hypothetical protein CVT26_008720 [Gymnopilus dilepis]|uniref:TOG domain-containing protein n=1 Tax=Gymnopilus dilepis TaxID=231916 RepID=A0A409YG79_9AGAR|nr:hypothetical protein CVT26_008720 [Gymnopilus dilepis]
MENVEVCHAALLASVTFLSVADPTQLAQSISLMSRMLDTLPSLANSDSAPQFSNLTPLTTSHLILFAPHLQSLRTFLPLLILPPVDCGPTPTVGPGAGRPFPAASRGPGGGGGSGFVFPPPGSAGESIQDEDAAAAEDDKEKDERSTLRFGALEFMISLSEARPNMVRKVPGWVEVMVRACLEGMGELDEDEGAGPGLDAWLNEDVTFDQLDLCRDGRPASTIRIIHGPSSMRYGWAFRFTAGFPVYSMMASYDWLVRHGGLMAITAIGERTGQVMQKELQKIVELVTPMFSDSHPRMRGQLCTDLEEIIQKRFHEQLFAVLIPALEEPEPRVHAHAASALINFCEAVERETLLPYLDPIVERLLQLLNPNGDGQNTKRYVQEQAITTLAMVADASEATFAKHYPTIMPLLLNVLSNADGPGFGKLRVKAIFWPSIEHGPELSLRASITILQSKLHPE